MTAGQAPRRLAPAAIAKATRTGWLVLLAALVSLPLRGAHGVPGAVPPLAAPAPAPGLKVSLSLDRAFLVLGSDTEVTVAVEVGGPGAEALQPGRTFATVGTLEAPRPAGAPGHFTVRYVPPAERFPQVALLVVELGNGSQRVRGVLRVPLHGTTEVPLRTSPSASVTLRVAGQSFGPVTADRQGRVKIPIRVPPGVRTGIARAVDRNENVKETEVDLQPAPFRRVLVVAPPVLEVGSFAEVAVLALDGSGEPTAPGRLSLHASEGLVHPLGDVGAGEARFLVEVARRVGAGVLALTAVATGTPQGRADLIVPLVAGRPHALSLSPSTRRLVIGGGAQARIVVSAHDQFGNPTSADKARATVDDVPAPLRVTAGGQGILIVPPPTRYDGHDHLTVQVFLGDARATQDIHLTGGSPVTLTLTAQDARLIGDGHRGTELRVRAFDRNGTPTLVPGLSWQMPGGRIRHVRMPREGEYLADFIPDRARQVHRETVAVTATEKLRATANLEVAPPPVWLLIGGRFGFSSNLGHAVGPVAFVELLTPLPRRSGRVITGLAVGYLRGDMNLTGPGDATSRLEINQVPVLAVARYRFGAPSFPEVAVGGGFGASFAATHITPDSGGQAVASAAWALALQADAEVAFPLKPGRLVVGARYLWIDLGRTSHGDNIRGNSAGLIGDLGYRMIW
jgi:hypothetical protein